MIYVFKTRIREKLARETHSHFLKCDLFKVTYLKNELIYSKNVK